MTPRLLELWDFLFVGVLLLKNLTSTTSYFINKVLVNGIKK